MLVFYGNRAVIRFFRDRRAAEEFLRFARKMEGTIVCRTHEEMLKKFFGEESSRALRALRIISEIEGFGEPDIDAFISGNLDGIRRAYLSFLGCFKLLKVKGTVDDFLKTLNFLILADALSVAHSAEIGVPWRL